MTAPVSSPPAGKFTTVATFASQSRRTSLAMLTKRGHRQTAATVPKGVSARSHRCRAPYSVASSARSVRSSSGSARWAMAVASTGWPPEQGSAVMPKLPENKALAFRCRLSMPSGHRENLLSFRRPGAVSTSCACQDSVAPVRPVPQGPSRSKGRPGQRRDDPGTETQKFAAGSAARSDRKAMMRRDSRPAAAPATSFVSPWEGAWGARPAAKLVMVDSATTFSP